MELIIFFREVLALVKQNRFDHIIIESTGISEPLPVAETFLQDILDEEPQDGSPPQSAVISLADIKESTGEDLEDRPCLMDLTEIDSMVTVVDASTFLKDMRDAEDLRERCANDARAFTFTPSHPLLATQLHP